MNKDVLSPVSTTLVDGPIELTDRDLTGDRFPLPVNTGRVDGRAFPLAESTISTRLVEKRARQP